MRTRRRRRGEHGQVMIVLALALIVLLGMMAVALDGGYALVQARRAQNAADFASIAGTASLKALCEQGAAPPTDQHVHAVIQDVIDQNANSIGSNWTADYVDQAGNDRGAAVSTSAATVPPPYACGVTVQLNSTWMPYIAQVLGITTLSAKATAKALNGVQPGKTVGIVALDKVGPHSILGNGQGTFTVHGDIFANSAVPNNPWTSTQAGGYSYTDVIDAKDNSNLSVFGNLISVTGMPFDWCFGNRNVPANGAKPNGWNEATQGPWNRPPCSVGNVRLAYEHYVVNQAQVSDPVGSALADPIANTGVGLCPGQSSAPQYNSGPPGSLLQPGVYNYPVLIAGTTQLADCGVGGAPGALDPTSSGYPGVYRFMKGLSIAPVAGAVVEGYNILIATGAPYPMAGNVPGTVSKSGVFTATPGARGNGAPCFPSDSPDVDGTSPRCAGSNSDLYGVVSLNQKSFNPDNIWGTGTNFSLIVGGKGTVTLSAPSYGIYNGMSFFQARGTPGNFGFDAEAGDSAAITVTGTVYNNSVANYGSGLPQEYWDVGTIYYPGGIVQTGMGTGTSQTASSGSVTINGTCIVDDFVTDGNSTITVNGAAYTLPGLSSLSGTIIG
jgi:Flp pilus assembly protein TadG